MRVGTLVTSRWYNIVGVVVDTGIGTNGRHWADVHWVVQCALNNIQLIDNLEVICK